MFKFKFLGFIALLLSLGACTSVKVNQIESSYNLSHVCIENNPKVTVPNFLEIISNGFSDHSITTEVYDEKKPVNCKYHLTYTALRSWDVVTYLSHAELRLFQGDKKIGDAEFHLNGKGGFAFTKWNSTEVKMKPVIDQLLANQ